MLWACEGVGYGIPVKTYFRLEQEDRRTYTVKVNSGTRRKFVQVSASIWLDLTCGSAGRGSLVAGVRVASAGHLLSSPHHCLTRGGTVAASTCRSGEQLAWGHWTRSWVKPGHIATIEWATRTAGGPRSMCVHVPTTLPNLTPNHIAFFEYPFQQRSLIREDFSIKINMYFLSSPWDLHKPPPLSSVFIQPNDIRWIIRVIKLLVMQFSPPFCCVLSLRWSCSSHASLSLIPLDKGSNNTIN
jgi:hypothetical protein